MNASQDQRFQLTVALEPLPDGSCPANLNDLLRHIEEHLRVSMKLPYEINGWQLGSEEPGVDDRIRPWLRVDARTGAFLGLYFYNTFSGYWERGGAVGERLTKVRTEETVEKDRQKWGLLAGWALADGKHPGVADLRTKINVTLDGGKVTISGTAYDVQSLTGSIPSPWFSGEGPDYDVYTVVKVAS